MCLVIFRFVLFVAGSPGATPGAPIAVAQPVAAAAGAASLHSEMNQEIYGLE